MVVTLCGWEGNRRSGVALAMRHDDTPPMPQWHLNVWFNDYLS